MGKLKVLAAFIAIIMLYMVIPSGTYGIDDVREDYAPLSFGFKRLSNEQFILQASANANPDKPVIVIPLTTTLRDGTDVGPKAVKVTSGDYRDGTGAAHLSTDYVIDNYSTTHSLCPVNGSTCPDFALVAPISGTIDYIQTNEGHEKEYNADGDNAHCSRITIAGEGGNAGYYVTVVHMIDCPAYKVGDHINQGDFIGFECNQGNSSGTHAHVHVSNCRAWNRSQRWPFRMYCDKLVLHSSITEIMGTTTANSGITAKMYQDITDRERYDSVVLVPVNER